MGNPLDKILEKQREGRKNGRGKNVTPRDQPPARPIAAQVDGEADAKPLEPDPRDNPDFLEWDDCPDANEWCDGMALAVKWNRSIWEAARMREEKRIEKIEEKRRKMEKLENEKILDSNL